MTVNVITTTEQHGNAYAVMANLALPELWPESDIQLLQNGLARALADYFSVPASEVHVVTTIVPSGRVVEDGKTIEW